MPRLSKSKLLAFLQCPKRLWLEVNRADLREVSSTTEASFQIGYEVGEVARRLYDPKRSGVILHAPTDGYDVVLARSLDLLSSSAPIFEAGFTADGAIAFADVMLPVGRGPSRAWRMVEVKSSTSVKDYYRDDAAIQSFVARSAGVPLKSIAIAHIDSTWVYPGDGDYDGLLIENDLTDEAFARTDEVKSWIAEAQHVIRRSSEPKVCTGGHCSKPYECGFQAYCQSQEPQAKYPVSWLPRLQSKDVKNFIETKAITDLRHVPDEYLNETQQRVKSHTLSGRPYFDAVSAAAELAAHKLPACFLDFETILFPVPVWKGTRPYQQIPFQFSLHRLSRTGKLEHRTFLDLTGEDPSQPFAEALIEACDGSGPVFAYNAPFEARCMKELAERFPRLKRPLLAIVDRLVDLMPIARRHYYHPSQQGSWSIKSVLPTVVPDLDYGDLEGVQDGGMAMAAYRKAVHTSTSLARRDEIHRQLTEYCRLDTYALVRLWRHFSGRSDLAV